MEAHTKYLDNVFSKVGKWSATAIGYAVLLALLAFLLKMNGWSKII